MPAPRQTKALNKTLQARLKKTEAENQELRRQNEAAYGQVIRVREMERQVERLKAENKRLKSQPATSKVAEPGFDTELDDLGVRMNSALNQLISEIPRGIAQGAIETLREAQGFSEVKNLGGFLNKAIRALRKYDFVEFVRVFRGMS